MASSQVEISSSSSPFGCVLRDHNRRRNANVTATHVAKFRNNLKTLVMDRLNDCISITTPNTNNTNPNPNPNPNFRVPKTNENTTNPSTPRRSCILDRRATKPLHRTLSSIDRQRNNHHSQHISTSAPQTAPPPPPPSKEQVGAPLPQTGSDKETSKLGASSLVQIWEKRLNVSSNHVGLNGNGNGNANGTVSSSGKQAPELVNTEQEQEPEQEQEQEQEFSVEAGDFEDERYEAGPGSEDGFADWHSNRTSSSSSTQSQSWDAGERESERVRVADIIRRLTLTAAKPPHPSLVEDSEQHSNESSSASSHPTLSLSLREQVEHKCLSHVLCSPRIRGRQAFADLLMQMERDRQKELDTLLDRRPVSKFPQRGRIQSLLRLKIMKRGMAVEDEQQRPQFVITPRENQGFSTIMHLRERFSRVGENGLRSPLGDMLNNNNNDEKTQSDTDSHATYTNDSDNHQVGARASDIASASASASDSAIHSSNMDTVDDHTIPEDVKEQVEDQGHDPPTSEPTWQDTPNLILNSQDSINGWEESEAGEENYGAESDYMGTSYNWFTDISRPRSYWEDRRKTWYQEMLDSNSANNEIRQLIERKTVSNFLTSDFRERIDKLMVSRLEQRTRHQEEYNDEDNDGAEEEELWCFSEGHTQPKSSSDNDEEEEETSLIRGQYHEASDYMDQSASPLQFASPSILSSWSYQDNEMGEDSNRAASTSSPQPFRPQFSSNNQQSSLVSRSHHPSIEMELIYDLRGHMEQLYQEMSELRKSIKCCMDMQLMMQQSIKQEVVAGGRGRKSKSRKRKCCICQEMAIDSLLYRCGHMCSCMKCAKELQWRGGKCPVCGAPIDDVVRASFTHS